MVIWCCRPTSNQLWNAGGSLDPVLSSNVIKGSPIPTKLKLKAQTIKATWQTHTHRQSYKNTCDLSIKKKLSTEVIPPLHHPNFHLQPSPTGQDYFLYTLTPPPSPPDEVGLLNSAKEELKRYETDCLLSFSCDTPIMGQEYTHTQTCRNM